MQVALKARARSWVASSGALRATGATAAEAVVALKRASLAQLGRAGRGVDHVIEWDIDGEMAPRDDDVELSADLVVEEIAGGWRWRSKGGAVSGAAKTLDGARDAAARASWRALAVRLADEDLARAGAMRIAFDVKTTSAWIVDHLAPGELSGGYRVRARFAALKKALGAPRFDPWALEPVYGWGLRGQRKRTAWIGVRLREADAAMSERDAALYAAATDELELAATNAATAKSVTAWVRARVAAAKARR